MIVLLPPDLHAMLSFLIRDRVAGVMRWVMFRNGFSDVEGDGIRTL